MKLKSFFAICITIGFLAASILSSLADDTNKMSAPKIRTLLITGGHEYDNQFHTLFEGWPELAGMKVSTSQTAFQFDLRKQYDVIVLYDFTRDLGDKEKRNLRDFVESGKGLVVLHHAILSYQKWPWWFEEVVGGRYRLEPDGNHPASSAKDGQELLVTPIGNHPITAGIKPFVIQDEPYKGMWISQSNHVLLTTSHSLSDPSIGWISSYPRSRVFFTQLGHGPGAYLNPSYRMLVHNAILWAGKRLE